MKSRYNPVLLAVIVIGLVLCFDGLITADMK